MSSHGCKNLDACVRKGDVGEALRDSPQLDRDATLKLARYLFSGDKLVPIGDGDLSYTCPPDDELHIGCFPNISIVAAKEFGIDYPSKLAIPFVAAGGSGTVYLHAMHSVVDWFAFAQWINGTLVRSLSLSPESPFPFHPLELGEADLKEFFGYQLEGPLDRALLEPESIRLLKYKRSRSRWKFW